MRSTRLHRLLSWVQNKNPLFIYSNSSVTDKQLYIVYTANPICRLTRIFPYVVLTVSLPACVKRINNNNVICRYKMHLMQLI